MIYKMCFSAKKGHLSDIVNILIAVSLCVCVCMILCVCVKLYRRYHVCVFAFIVQKITVSEFEDQRKDVSSMYNRVTLKQLQRMSPIVSTHTLFYIEIDLHSKCKCNK